MSILALPGRAVATLLSRLRPGVRMDPRVLVSADTSLEPPVRIGSQTSLIACNVGRGTYLAGNCRLAQVRFGRFCSIGHQLVVAAGSHPTAEFASTHPAFFSTAKQAGFTFADRMCFEELPRTASGFLVNFGHDVWIGDRVTIVTGVNVGTGAIVGAGAVVTRDLAPYGIYAGVPAREIGRRCSAVEAAELLATAWWDRDLGWLKLNWQAFRTVPALLEALRRPSSS